MPDHPYSWNHKRALQHSIESAIFRRLLQAVKALDDDVGGYQPNGSDYNRLWGIIEGYRLQANMED